MSESHVDEAHVDWWQVIVECVNDAAQNMLIYVIGWSCIISVMIVTFRVKEIAHRVGDGGDRYIG